MEISAVFIIFERNDKSMINISGHYRDTRRSIGYENHDCKIMVNCCGYQKFLTKDYSQKRTIGRIDYQIIYIFKGCGHYLLKNQWQTLLAGQILLFRDVYKRQRSDSSLCSAGSFSRFEDGM